MENVSLVFLHGAGLGNYIWDDMKPILKRNALHVDFPNRGEEYNLNKNFDIQDYCDTVIQKIESWNSKAFVIVAHSLSGIIGLKLCDYFGDKVKGFVAISAAIPENGKSFVSCLPFPQKCIMPIILNLFGTKPPNKTIQNELCNDLSENQSELIINRFTPESRKLYTSDIHYKSVSIETLYIKLTDDRAFSVSIQDKMISNLKPDKIITLESGHLPMMSQPTEIFKIIDNFMETI